eukprot:scaffold3378_cov104-Cylindrotheca_fusiformis.AAC.7
MLVSRLIICIGTRIRSMIQIIEGAIAQVLTIVPLTYRPLDSPSILPRGRHSSQQWPYCIFNNDGRRADRKFVREPKRKHVLEQHR